MILHCTGIFSFGIYRICVKNLSDWKEKVPKIKCKIQVFGLNLEDKDFSQLHSKNYNTMKVDLCFSQKVLKFNFSILSILSISLWGKEVTDRDGLEEI